MEGGGTVGLSGRVQALDGLRGVAILLVFAFHAQRVLAGTAVVDVGWSGVDLFFVLSGFLITGILRKTRGQQNYWRNFMVRRVLRIFPLYLAFLAVVLGTRLFTGIGTPAPWWSYPLFLSNFPLGMGHSEDIALDLTWSLAVEEQVYLLWPLLVGLLPRRALLVALAAMVVGSPTLRAFVHDPAHAISYMWTPCRVDSLAWGALAAVGMEFGTLRRWVAPIAWTGLLLLFGTWTAMILVGGDLRNDQIFATVGYTALAAGGAGVVMGLATSKLEALGQVLTWRPLHHLGTVSYGAYLLHGVCIVVVSYLDVHWLLGSAVALALTWFSAALLFRTLELPILRLKDVWAPYR